MYICMVFSFNPTNRNVFLFVLGVQGTEARYGMIFRSFLFSLISSIFGKKAQ